MLGPIPTDIAAGYDHIAAAIGASYSSRYGADLLCYITPAEHLALPNEEDVKEGVKAVRLAAHIGDMVKLKDRAREKDKLMSKARRDLDWAGQFKYAMFPDDAKKIRSSRMPEDEATCTMCGNFCASKNANEVFEQSLEGSCKK